MQPSDHFFWHPYTRKTPSTLLRQKPFRNTYLKMHTSPTHPFITLLKSTISECFMPYHILISWLKKQTLKKKKNHNHINTNYKISFSTAWMHWFLNCRNDKWNTNIISIYLVNWRFGFQNQCLSLQIFKDGNPTIAHQVIPHTSM